MKAQFQATASQSQSLCRLNRLPAYFVISICFKSVLKILPSNCLRVVFFYYFCGEVLKIFTNMNEQILINSTPEMGVLSIMIDGKSCNTQGKEEKILAKLNEIKNIINE